MAIAAGLVGLPNVGKSTLFNALTQASVPAENYPFCTIEPHVAITPVPDQRMHQLKTWYKSEKLIPAAMQFVDIAGLVKGAASGAGLGNQFLANIREVDLIIHVVRCFDDSHVLRAEPLSPLGDLEVIMAELMLKDIESVTKRQGRMSTLIKAAKGKPQELLALERETALLDPLLAALNSDDMLEIQKFRNNPDVSAHLLLSTKNFLIVANVGDTECSPEQVAQNPYVDALIRRWGADKVIPLSARLEAELVQLNSDEAQEIALLAGRTESGLEKLIAASYRALNQITFFTCGPKEIHAWTVTAGSTIRQAAGVIHSDLEKGFICAEVFNVNDIKTGPQEASLRQAGAIRTEGAQYRVNDGDIIHVRFNVS